VWATIVHQREWERVSLEKPDKLNPPLYVHPSRIRFRALLKVYNIVTFHSASLSLLSLLSEGVRELVCLLISCRQKPNSSFEDPDDYLVASNCHVRGIYPNVGWGYSASRVHHCSSSLPSELIFHILCIFPKTYSSAFSQPRSRFFAHMPSSERSLIITTWLFCFCSS